tara:strand:+ start:724 stop:999 length:276 start_codon:yes stop_codon:yes gene_type:complete
LTLQDQATEFLLYTAPDAIVALLQASSHLTRQPLAEITGKDIQYVRRWEVKDAYQSEDELERDLIRDLQNQDTQVVARILDGVNGAVTKMW